MIKRVLKIIAAITIVLLNVSIKLHAEWQIDGIPICTEPSSQINLRTISTTDGNIIVLWQDRRDDATNNSDIYAQKFDSLGNILWTEDGIPICAEAWVEEDPQIVPDESGGFIISWIDYRNSGSREIFAQRVDANGNIVWSENDVPVCTEPAEFNYIMNIIPDTFGGAIICWDDTRNGSENKDIYAQRISATGNVLWAYNGQAICTESASQYRPNIVSDGNGGAIICWEDNRSGADSTHIYAQHVDSNGNAQWINNGIRISNTGDSQDNKQISSLSGKYIIFWRNDDSDEICAQCIDNQGDFVWSKNAINISGEMKVDGTWGGFQVTSDDDGGALIVWVENDNLQKFYIEKIDSSGNSIWNIKPIYVPSNPRSRGDIDQLPNIINDGKGGALICFKLDFNLFISHLNQTGEIESEGLLCARDGEQGYQDLTRNSGGIFVTWRDSREGNWDIYSQRINNEGKWTLPIAEIDSAKDISGDEGGWIRITMNGSKYDDPRVIPYIDYPVTGYNIWRKIDPNMTTSNYYTNINYTGNLEALIDDNSHGIIISNSLATQIGFPPGNWESLGFHSATQDSIYEFCVGTLKDSTQNDKALEEYVITAHTTNTSVYFISESEIGYSVDNLSPSMPEELSGTQSTNPVGLRIKWSSNTEQDLSHYYLHKDTTMDFIPSPENRLKLTADTTYFDSEWTIDSEYYYKLVAVDRHGNISTYSVLSPDEIVQSLLQSFSVERSKYTVKLSWQLSRFENQMQFFIYRRNETEGEYELLSPGEIIKDNLTFEYKDKSCLPDEAYQYRIEIGNANNNTLLFESNYIFIPPMPLTLQQNYPNPFNPSTTIEFYLPRKSMVKLIVFDVSGKQVCKLIEKQLDKGYYTISWEGTDDNGNRLSSGIYFYQLQSDVGELTRKMVILK